jgi:acyl carrier protein
MGLDAVELIMEVEDAFDFKIPDDNASQIITVGDLYDYILELKRDTVSPRNVCLSAATFYLIRRAVCAELGSNPKSIRPQIRLDSTFPQKRRRSFWAELQTAINLKLPRLARPKWLVAIAASLSIAASAWIGFLVSPRWGHNGAVGTFLVALFASGVLAAVITSPFQTQFRPAFSTYRGLSQVVLAHNYVTLSQRFNSWNPTDVWEAMKVIIVEQLGVQPEKVTRNAKFYGDLGMS